MEGTPRSIREGSPADVAAALALFDEAVAWLVARGQEAQWGAEPFSARRSALARVTEWAAGHGMRLAVTGDGEVIGLSVLGARPPWVDSAGEPERYLEALVSSRRHAGERIGGELIGRALDETRAAGVALLRADCWAGSPDLIAYYERHGFRRTATFTLDDGWAGQVLARWV